ncbi:MAG: diguanylate cyclase [Gammaproteobacteria bacterium]|nr:diguanylate cyclase [Gammaproteobacteria bacterium]
MSIRVLIVEPARLYQRLIDSMVKDVGGTADLASNVTEASEYLAINDYDLLFVAAILGDTTGIELAEQIKQQTRHANLIINIITSDIDKSTHEQALASAITEVFHKGDLEEVSEFLTQYLKSNQNTAVETGSILYVEDDIAMAQYISAVMRDAGFDVVHTTIAEDAFKLFGKQAFDLVVTDLFLAGRNSGTTLVRKIRNLGGEQAQVPILVMSGTEDTATRVAILESGASDYVAKPVLVEELIARIRNLIRMKKLFERVEIQRKALQKMAMTDQLTGLYNRHSLSDMAPKYLSEACRHGIPLSLVVVDVDHFKKVNDTFGHSTGDIVLVEVAALLRDSCRNEDFAARFGGEEFVLLFPHCTLEDAINKAEQIRMDIEGLNPEDIHLTASFGVSCLSLDKLCTFDELFNDADSSVYEAKESGRNRVVAHH